MPKETLALLERDTERLLFAGAQVARGDADLDARRQRLAALVAKAPVLAKVVEQVDKVQKASGKASAAELLNLSAQMAQVRGAQAAPAATPLTGPSAPGLAPGDLGPLPPAEPVESPLSPTELLSLVNALTVSGKHRPKIVADAVDRGAVRDLRLLPYCVRALGDPAVGYVVADKLLPSLGHLVVPELEATLRIQHGKELDTKKLRVLAEIVGDEIKPRLVDATVKGSPDIRRTAVELLGDRDPAAAEPIALRLLAEDRSGEVRKAAVTALGGGKSDATLDALFKAFANADLRRQAGLALARLDHPKATERAVALLTPELLSLANLKLPKADTKAKKEQNAKLEREHSDKVAFLSFVLDLLASRKDKLQTAETVLGVFHNHKIKEVKNAAALALLKSGYEKAFEELAPSVYDAEWDVQEDFVEGILEHDAAHVFDRLGRFLDPATFKGKNHVAFASRILSTLEGHSESGEEPTDDEAEEADDEPEARPPSFLQKDPRWTDAALRLLDHKDLMSDALDVLAKVKSDKAREAIIAVASAQKKGDNAWRILQVLALYRDPRVPPLMLRFLDLVQGSWARRWVFRTLREYDDPAIAPALKAWGVSKKKLDKRDKEELESALQFLERDRALTKGV
jgi:HEAT repeat protein